MSIGVQAVTLGSYSVFIEDKHRCDCLGAEQKQLLQTWQSACGAKLGHEIDLLIADTLFTWIHKHLNGLISNNGDVDKLTASIDRLVLHRYLGIPFFFLVLYGMFLFAIDWMGQLQESIDLLTEWVFVDGMAYGLHHLQGVNDFITTLFAHGLGRGINTTLTFVPVFNWYLCLPGCSRRQWLYARAALSWIV